MTTPSIADVLGRFGHHPDPAIDFEIEVEELQSIIIDKELGLRADEELPVDRMFLAMQFRVGGDPGAVEAKFLLRELERRLATLARETSHGEAGK